MPFVIGIAGWKDSGKTTLCGKLVELLLLKGLKVGFIKHTEKSICPKENADSNTLCNVLGESVLWGEDGWAYTHKKAVSSLKEIVSRIYPGYDVVILEGGKRFPLPKIWVKSATPPEGVPGIIAYYGEGAQEETLPNFLPGQEKALADFIADMAGKSDSRIEVYVNGKRFPIKKFVGEFIEGAIRGMFSSLKQRPEDAENINIFLRGKK